MTRTTAAALSAGVLALGLCAAPALAASGHHGISSRAGVVASATVASCLRGASASDRSARFSASMQALPRTRTMAISFDLFERTKGGAFSSVPAPGFGVWQTSSPGITSFTANENVLQLPAPASFRAVVHYRWFNRRHRVIRIDTRVTPACIEPVVRTLEPDLAVASITHAPGSPPATTEDFTVAVRNAGPGDAGAFAVALSVGGVTLPQQTVSSLAAGSTTTVQFTGPRCTAGASVTATIDPLGAITEPANDRRTVTIPCRARTGATGTTG
jgi:hypothetical protein